MKRLVAGALIVLLVAVVVGALGGCSSPASSPPAKIDVTNAESGSSKTLQVGQELDVALEANPTTGYTWALDGALPAQLTQMGEPTYKASGTAIGAGGVQLWKFQGAAAGQGTLKMKYYRSFEATTPPVKTFTLNVDVK